MYQAKAERYESLEYRRCGESGLKLPPISLGLWHNFGENASKDKARELLCTAFDLGITHFDLANNYGPPAGSAEEMLGSFLKSDFASYRDELIISSKAGYYMWPGPYGDWGSRKYLIASLNQSLKRLGCDYVDIFYHHRPDPNTPLEETMQALDSIVRSGKALYIGISNYPQDLAVKAVHLLKNLGTPCLIHQPRYNLFDRHHEKEGLFQSLALEGCGSIAFSPLDQGILSDRYLEGIPQDSRVRTSGVFLKPEHLSDDKLKKVSALQVLAKARGQSMAQMALAWVLRKQGTVQRPDNSLQDVQVTSALIGASSAQQIKENVEASSNLLFSTEELNKIEAILAS